MIEGQPPAAGSDRLTRAEWMLLLVLAAIQFTHLVDFMIVLPLGPQYIRVLKITPQEFGILVSVYGFSAGISGLLSALFVDRFDRKRAVLFLYAGFTVSTLLCAVAGNFWVLLAARALAGGFGGVVAANVLAIVGDVIPFSRRATAMGIVMSAFSLGLILGVPLGLHFAEEYGWWVPFAVLGALSAVVWVMVLFVLPPMRGHLDESTSGKRSLEQALRDLLDVLTNPNHVRAYALMVALVLGVFMIVPYIATYMVANVGIDRSDLKWIYLCGGLTTICTVTVFGRLADRFGKLLVFRVMALFTVVPILLITNLPPAPLWVAIASSTLFMVTTSGRMVPAQALITACAQPQQRGSFLSVVSSVQQLASGVAAILGGMILGKAAGGEGGEVPTDTTAIEPITGYVWVGLISAAFTVLSVILGGYLRAAPGGLGTVDSAEMNDGKPESIEYNGETRTIHPQPELLPRESR